jgi:hypothetical protein
MKKLVFVIALCWIHAGHAQTVLENNPASVRWFRVNTPNFNVLFQEGFDVQAQRMANTLEHIRSAEANTLGRVPRKISVVLQNHSSVSNGFVSMFPRRTEFFTMPTQNYNFAGTNDWLNLLVSHEYRHIVQYQHANRGFNRMLSFLFGSPAFAGMAHASAPDWFWEGDAVVAETAFTPGGRGKIPNFGLVFRTNLVEGRIFNYHKQYLRSYKHNIPNHYVFGYHMVSWLRRETNDPEIWEKITSRSWSVPFVPFAFSNAIAKETGYSVTRLYRKMAEDLANEWKQQIDSLQLTSFETINKRRSSRYTDYLYPQPRKDGSVLVQKEGIGDIATFVLLDEQGQEKVFVPGFLNDAGMLSSTEDVVVWNEFGFDPRWQVRNYSLIKAYNLAQGKKVVVSRKDSRFGSAAISPDQRFIVTIRSDEKYRHNVVVISYPEGNILRVFPNPENHFYAMPRWSNDGRRIVVLKTTPKGKTISLISVTTGEEKELMPVVNENFGHPVLHGNYVLFNVPFNGIDNIHALDTETGKRFVVTTSRYGAYNPAVSVDGKFLYYNDQARNGMDVVRVTFDPGQWRPYIPEVKAKSFFQHLVDQEGTPNLFDSIPDHKYPVRRYSKAKNVINPFSWGAFIENDLAKIDFGITSRDILSTTSLTAGYTFDINERTGFWKAGVSYQGLYPIIDLDFTMGNRSVDEGAVTTIIIKGEDTTRVRNNMVFNWREQNMSAGLRLPLILTRSKYSSGLTIQNRVGLTRVSDFRNDWLDDRLFPTFIRNDTIFQGLRFLNYVGNGTLIYNYSSLFAYRMLKTSRRDIYSRWGQALTVRYYSTPFGGDFDGGVVSATGYLYFPGVAKHHVIYGHGSVQENLSSTGFMNTRDLYLFRNTVPLPRGQSVSRFKRMYTTSLNYTLPLWYPDIAIGPLLNIQRFRLNLFSDYAYGDQALFSGVDRTYLSVGGELTVDFNVMRFLPQFDIGVRYSYGIDPATRIIEVVVGTFNF